MNKLLNPREFYEETLKEAGVQPPPDELQKFASAKGLDIDEAKLANAFFEQLQLDNVPYETHAMRRDDALKMAQAYIQHAKEVQADAVKVADGLLRTLEHAAEGWLAHNNIQLDARTAVKIAGLQAESAQSYEATPPEKRAAFFSKDPSSAFPGGGGTQDGATPTFAPGWFDRHMSAANHGVKGVAQAANQGVKDVAVGGLRGMKETAMFPFRYPYLTGALGLGAMGLMHHRNRRDQAAEEETDTTDPTTAPVPPSA